MLRMSCGSRGRQLVVERTREEENVDAIPGPMHCCVPYDTERSHNEFETYGECESLLVKEEASKASGNDPMGIVLKQPPYSDGCSFIEDIRAAKCTMSLRFSLTGLGPKQHS